MFQTVTRSWTLRSRRLVVAIASFVLASNLAAQRPDSVCGFARCGLNIIPRLTALDVVRGENEVRVGSLAFLWPSDVSPVFANDAIARGFAHRATSRRRVGAMMTDVGLAFAAGGVIGMLRDGGHIRGVSSVFAISGGVLVGASIPVHFAADADLSRAVWRYNQTTITRGSGAPSLFTP
jgi:hypothetical protein